MAHKKYLFVSPTGFNSAGDTLYAAVFKIPGVDINFDRRCVQINHVNDTITIGSDYNAEEMARELAGRALVLLRRKGYAMYLLQDPAC
jgi:hypothetical protein